MADLHEIFGLEKMDDAEAQYNLAKRRGPGLADVIAGWEARSAKQRQTADVQLDVPYGDGDRERGDFFFGGNSQGPLLIYIHGGYWQRGDKQMYGFISEAFVHQGVSVMVINYDLTPMVSMTEIPAQIRRFVVWAYRKAGAQLRKANAKHGFDPNALYMMGHSAGGHLTALMMATHWSKLDSALPNDLIRGAIPISGVFELEPLLTTSINDVPAMSQEEARALSPCFLPPATHAPQLVVVGGGETEEFIRQSDDHAARWRSEQRRLMRYTVPNADHFDVLEPLTDECSPLFEHCMQLLDTN